MQIRNFLQPVLNKPQSLVSSAFPAINQSQSSKYRQTPTTNFYAHLKWQPNKKSAPKSAFFAANF